ncbi:MAG: DUF374 domain-containing protein [bacterium]|nr:DUF374 domain-containing protein [bacterium]
MSLKSKVKEILNLKISQNLLSIFLVFLVRFIHITTFVRYRNVAKLKKYMKGGNPVILVFWHSRSLLITKFWRDNLGMIKHPIYGIFSTHRDGRLIGDIFGLLGVRNIISSAKDTAQASGVAMKSMRLLKSGKSIGFTPDGPLGPSMTFVSDSAFLFAKASGVPIVPVCISAKNPIILNTWDSYVFTKPFHRAIIEVGDFLFIDKKISDADFKKVKDEFEKKMVEDTLRLDRELKMPKILPGGVKKKK